MQKKTNRIMINESTDVEQRHKLAKSNGKITSNKTNNYHSLNNEYVNCTHAPPYVCICKFIQISNIYFI